MRQPPGITRARLLRASAAASVLPILARRARAARTILAATPIERADLSWWMRRHENKLAAAREQAPALVWLGDSITHNFESHGPPPVSDYAPVWDRFYGDRHALNLGFSGDTTANVLWRVENGEFDGINPKAVVLLIGANNLGHVHWSAEDTLAGMDAITGELRRRVPKATLIVIGTLPREGDDWVIETRRAINRGLAARYAHAPGARWIDATPIFESGGVIRRELYWDCLQEPPKPALHPSPDGMRRIATLIEPAIAEALGDRRHDTA